MHRRIRFAIVIAAVLLGATARAADEPLDAAEALLQKAQDAQVSGDIETMERSLDAACAMYRDDRGPDAERTLECERSRVFLIYQSGQGKRALQEGRAMVDARTRTRGADDRHTLRAQSDLALYLRDEGDLEGALALNRRTLEARTRTLGERDPHTLDSVANLAQVLDDLDRKSVV